MSTYMVLLALKTGILVGLLEYGLRLAARTRAAARESTADAEDSPPGLKGVGQRVLYGLGALVLGAVVWFQSGLFDQLAANVGIPQYWNLVPVALAGAYFAARKWSELERPEVRSAASADSEDGPVSASLSLLAVDRGTQALFEGEPESDTQDYKEAA